MTEEYPETREEVLAIADGLSFGAFARKAVSWAQDETDQAIAALRALVTYRAEGTMEKHFVPRVVARALLHKGPEGVAVIADMVTKAPGAIYPAALMTTLWDASRGRIEPVSDWGPGGEDIDALGADVDPDTQRAAGLAVRELLVDSLANDDLMFTVVQVLDGLRMREDEARELLLALTESTIRLTPSLIEEFEALIEAEHREEVYQAFLSDNPVFLDPLAAEVIPKQRLGLEHITDYAVRRHDGRWLLVEIEKPQAPIVTGQNDFTSHFTHGFGQVVDFQRWIEANAAYAQSLMPRIASPRGLLVIGRRSELDDEGLAKLRRFNANSSTIDVTTFDDLATNARILYQSLHRI